MTKHTPGPWIAEEENVPDAPSLEILQEEGHNRSIVFFDKAVVTDEDRANARLMAAAPDLLEGCRMLLACSLPSDVSGQRMVERAREAIRKATGE